MGGERPRNRQRRWTFIARPAKSREMSVFVRALARDRVVTTYWPFLLAALPFLEGVVMFVIKEDPEKIEKNVVGWRAITFRFKNWIAAKWWCRWLALALVTAGALGTGIWILTSNRQTDPKFEAAKLSFPAIGEPLGPSEASPLYEEAHEHGMVIWVASLGTHFVLFPMLMLFGKSTRIGKSPAGMMRRL
jgi:hypothetical protein